MSSGGNERGSIPPGSLGPAGVAAPTSVTILARCRRLTPFVAPFTGKIVLAFGLSLFGTVLGLLWPIFTKILIDNVLLGRNLRLLVKLSSLMVLATATGYVVGAVSRYYYTQATARILFDLRKHLFAHLEALPLRFHGRARMGDILSRLNTDIAEVQSVLTDTAFTFLINILVLIGTVAFLVWLDWRLFLVTLIVLPLQLYSVRKVRPAMVNETRKVREVNASISSFLVESLSAIKFVKLYGLEEAQVGRLESLGERFVEVVMRSEMLAYLGSTSSTATTFLGGALVTLCGGYLVIRGDMTIGALIAFSAYQSRAFSPLQALVGLYIRLEQSGVSLGRIFEFLDLPVEPGPRGGEGLQPAEVRGEIDFRAVFFAHEASEPVLQGVSFHVPAGGRLVIVGASGAGKTTIADLLARLHDPDRGTILLDGHDLRELSASWLRSRIAVVSHEPYLFHTSIEENLRYATPEASPEEVREAARTVGLDDLVASLPEGYATVVGERGARLSTGQQQRIALARALLRHPSVLVLDEAMSGLDVASEAAVRDAMEAVRAGRTTIQVTHRLSSLPREALVIVLEGGRIVWEGAAADLPASRRWSRNPVSTEPPLNPHA